MSGWLETRLVAHSGGDLPRGSGWVEGQVAITDGRVPLGDDRLVRDLVGIAPFVALDDQDRMALGDMAGVVRMNRRGFEIDRLVYDAPRRQLELRGWVRPRDMELVLRIVPREHGDTRPGLGAVLTRPEGKVRLRLARREELLPGSGGRGPADR